MVNILQRISTVSLYRSLERQAKVVNYTFCTIPTTTGNVEVSIIFLEIIYTIKYNRCLQCDVLSGVLIVFIKFNCTSWDSQCIIGIYCYSWNSECKSTCCWSNRDCIATEGNTAVVLC